MIRHIIIINHNKVPWDFLRSGSLILFEDSDLLFSLFCSLSRILWELTVRWREDDALSPVTFCSAFIRLGSNSCVFLIVTRSDLLLVCRCFQECLWFRVLRRLQSRLFDTSFLRSFFLEWHDSDEMHDSEDSNKHNV